MTFWIFKVKYGDYIRRKQPTIYSFDGTLTSRFILIRPSRIPRADVEWHQ